MQCDKIQRLFSDLAEGRLGDPVAQELRRHLDECTDCRVAQQRAGRLQQLLALKRHERPPQTYFDNFLNEFHQRLEAEIRPREGWWKRLVANFTIETPYVWRYGLAGGVGAFLVAGILVSRAILPSWQIVVSRETPPTEASVLEFKPAQPSPFAARVQDVDSPLYSPMTPAPVSGGSVIIPGVAHDDAGAPRYVLDRITPVNYEVASRIHF